LNGCLGKKAEFSVLIPHRFFMIAAPIPANESERLQELYRLEILDTPYEQEFNELVQLASQLCQVPVSLITLIDHDRVWFKARVGTDLPEADRSIMFCPYAIAGHDDVFVVTDTTADERFFDNPVVANDPHIRFYAGAPLTTEAGYKLGTLCVIDTMPRDLTAGQRETLRVLSHQAVRLFDLRIKNKQLARQQQRLEELARTQTRIISIVSHDVRNPLGSLRSMLDMLEAGILEPEETAELITVGKRQVDSTTEMLNNLVDWGSVQLQNRPADKCPINLHDLVTSKFTKFQVAARLKANALVNDVPGDFTIESDENALRFVLRNLVSNAMKFTEGGRVTISACHADTGRACIRVEDTGVGMSEEVRGRLFDAQNRQSAPGTRREKGSGLGLLLVREYLEKLGGTLNVRSEPGQGTCVEVTL